jgi:ketosteroid isomerase-like protein
VFGLVPAATEADTGQPMSQENVEIVRRSFEAFNARDVDGLISLTAEECEWLPLRAQLEGIVYRGHAGVRQFVSDMDADWEAFRIDPLEFHQHPERVVAIGQVVALGQSGVEIDSIAGFVFELHQGRISRVTSHSDPEAALEAGGLAE